MLEGMILKPNMVLPGSPVPTRNGGRCSQRHGEVSPESGTRRRSGIAFLSGGQSGELASARLNAMNVRFKSRLPWALTFSFARAIQQPALEIWHGEETHVLAAHKLCIIAPGATGRRAVANTMPRWIRTRA